MYHQKLVHWLTNITESEELSTGISYITIDIEVEVTDGFPYPEDANDKITAIAVHDCRRR